MVTGTIIGISLMRVGVGWAMGGPAPLAQRVDVPRLVEIVDQAKVAAQAASAPLSLGPIPMMAPRWKQQMAHGLHPLLDSGTLLTVVAALLLNLLFKGAQGDKRAAIQAAKAVDAH